MTETPAAAPAPAVAPKPNSFARMAGALFSPDETFADIARRPDWVVPLVVIMIVALVAGFVYAQKVDFAAPGREAMEQRKDLSPEQMEMGLKMAKAMGKVLSYASPVLTVIVFAIIAGILLLAFRLFGGEGTFLQAFSATIYAWLPEVIKNVLAGIIMAVKGGTFSPVDLETIVRSNPAFLVTMKSNPVLFSLLTNIDLFGIWTLILFIIAFKHVARVSAAKSAATVITLRIVAVLFGLIGPALQTLRK